MPGRPKKVRRKEQTENKTGKLSRRGLEMTCRACNKKGHNKRGCHITKSTTSNVVPSATPSGSSIPSATPSDDSITNATLKTRRGRGRPKGSTNESRPY